MAKRTRQTQQKQPADLTPEQMNAAFPRLNRRIKELNEFDVASVNDRSDPRISAMEVAIDSTLVFIFGADSLDYDRYRSAKNLDTAGINMYGTPIHEVRKGLVRGIETAIALLEQIKTTFTEEMEDLGLSESGRALRAIEGLTLHPEIHRASDDLYRDGHYANAVEDSVKALNALVRLRSQIEDLDGSKLMEKVFNPKTPILRFNDLADESDKNEQLGFMMLFSGAVVGLRNPRAHKLINDDPEQALEFIAFISLLAKLLDKAKKN